MWHCVKCIQIPNAINAEAIARITVITDRGEDEFSVTREIVEVPRCAHKIDTPTVPQAL